MKIALIANPYSGHHSTRKHLPLVKKSLDDMNIQADIFISKSQDHIKTILIRLDIHKYDAVVAMGGDGTNFHMLNGLLSRYTPADLPPLGIIPAGSGNSFSKDLGINNIKEGLQALKKNCPRPVDMISFINDKETFYFVNLMGFGFVTDVAVTAQRFKRVHDLSYLIGVLHRTALLSFHHMELEIDGHLISGPNCFVEFCNSRYTGGNMLMAPQAKIDDGLMDIIITGPMTKKRLLGALPKIYTGSHVNMNEVTCIQAKRAEIRTSPSKTLLPDGEIMGHTPGIVQVIPKALRYLS